MSQPLPRKDENYPDAAFCTVLYKTYLFSDAESKASMWQGWFLSLTSICIVFGLYYWIYYRKRLLEQGNIDRANKFFLRVYRNIILVYLALMVADTLVITTNTIVYNLLGHTNWVYRCFYLSLMVILPTIQMSTLIFLFLKNTMSERGKQRTSPLPLFPLFPLFPSKHSPTHSLDKSSSNDMYIRSNIIHSTCICILRGRRYSHNSQTLRRQYIFHSLFILIIQAMSILLAKEEDCSQLSLLCCYYQYMDSPLSQYTAQDSDAHNTTNILNILKRKKGD